MKKLSPFLLLILIIGCGGGGGTSGTGSPPTVSTLPATSVSATGGVLNASVTANGLAVSAWFEWGADPALGVYDNTPTQSVGSGASGQLISSSLTALTGGTTYYYRVVASNGVGTSRGTIGSFTPGLRPSVTTLLANSVTTTGATLNGYTTPNGLTTNAWFEWGTDPALSVYDYTSTLTAGSGTVARLASATLVGLSTGTNYYFRVCASNISGISRGTISSFMPGLDSPGPDDPPPSGLWQPASGATPPSGNYVYLISDPGDYIGVGHSYTYTQANAQFSVSATGGHLSTNVTGDESWHGNFQAMTPLTMLQPGYYDSLQRWPFHNPVRGGLDWSGEGRGCNTLTGWFTVDNVTYDTGALTAIDLRFEQHCEGGAPALHGQVHWTSDDNAVPPGPIYPPPSGLWQPAPGATPPFGNYVYLQSDPGDYIGAGQTYTYTQASALLSVNASGGHLSTRIDGDQSWWGDFQAMNTLAQLQPGYYGDLQRYPFHNPVRGGLSWWGEGRGCNTLTGWFIVDNVTYDTGALTAIDLRFEQHCEGGGPALHGQIHWAP